jgi:hypothetical protein
VAGHAGDDPEDEHDGHQRPGDGSPHPPQSMALAASHPAAGHPFGELPDTDHADGGGPAPRLQPAATTAYRGQSPRRGPTGAVLAPALTGRRHQ